MLTHEQLKAKALENREVSEEYQRINREEFALLDMLLQARRDAGLTQAEVAARMGTKAPAIARMERALASGKHSPSISTVRRYLEVCGKQLRLEVA
jgi:predicted transcriptional regulator